MRPPLCVLHSVVESRWVEMPTWRTDLVNRTLKSIYYCHTIHINTHDARVIDFLFGNAGLRSVAVDVSFPVLISLDS